MTESDYLRSALALEPGTQAGRLFELRRAHRDEAPRVGVRSNRDEVQAALDKLADDLLESPVDELEARFEALDVSDFPDLARRLRRLDAVFEVRDEVLEALEVEGGNAEFLQSVRQMLVAPPRAAADIKRRALVGLSSKTRRRSAVRTVRAWKRDYPGFVELEAAWFEDALRSKRILKDRKKPLGLGLVFLIWIVLRIVMRLWRDS